MKIMKKQVSLLLASVMVLTSLAGCSGQVATTGQSEKPTETPEITAPADTAGDVPVKTGLSVVTSVSGSTDATAETDGVAQTNIALVAVTVDDDGVIDDCVIDMVQAKINFNDEGALLTDPATEFASKNELGTNYGMHKASSIGKDWSEQAAAMASYVVGKTVDEVKGIAVYESGKPGDADLASSVTLSIGDFISGIEDAASKASHLGAQKGDALKLASMTNMSKSTAATAEADGTAQAYSTIAAVTLQSETITSCYIDAVQADVNFDAAGRITSDVTDGISTKNELGTDYGMHKGSSIGKDWDEQTAAFCGYVTGKTMDEVAGIAVDENTKATDADLASSVTLSIGDFQALLAKAAL